MTARIVRSVAGMFAMLFVSATIASAQAPVLTASVTGNAFTLNWSATAGALGYRIDGGLAPGTTVGSIPVAATAYALSLPNGVYFVRVVALPGGEVSNEVRVQLPPAPATPTNLQIVRNGTAIVAMWQPGQGGGEATGYQLKAGTAPGGTLAVIPTVGNTFAIGGVPANTYYFRVAAVNGAGASAESAEVAVNMPAGGACDAPPSVTFQQSVFSTFFSLSWTPVPTAANYLISASFNGAPLVSDLAFGVGTNVSRRNNSLGIYDITVKAVFGGACGGTVGAPATARLVLDGAPPPGPRTANPAPGQFLSIPSYFRSVVDEMANARPDLLRNSCVSQGGNNRWLFELTKRLRDRDNRWGNNIKRCSQGLSQDIITYNVSSLPDEGARSDGRTTERNMRLFDVIGNHCPVSGGPGPNYTDVTPDTVNAGACAEWTLQYYLAAGYQP